MPKLFSTTFFADWGSAALVFVVSALAGRFASEGMTLVQWAGALVAVLGSITLAVAVRVWPAEGVAAIDED